MPTADVERLIDFYRRLGFEIDDEAYRGGTAPIFSIVVGDAAKINVHPPGFVGKLGLRGDAAAPGCLDICFVWDGTLSGCLKMLERAGVEIAWGPVAGFGGRKGVPATRIYVRDPDGNLLEWMIYESTEPTPAD